MRKISQFSSLLSYCLLATLVSFGLTKPVNAEPTATLTVIVNGLRPQNGQLCLRVFSNEQGFPMGNTGVKSGCTKITGSSVLQKFSGLKPGNYAVAVVDDENGDRKLDTDFFGIPKEGFGISNNPTVSIQTGTPSFNKASFSVKKNTTINILMKYKLDP
ncbi:MAG: DUF2141 domain-containing protein [Heteroscytonema crispum UTEX LB 1556]